ncbi:MAG TPA: PEP-utilizing enzyme, partial [Acidimicrobiales bacterium]|nr:PEP-utilizing enzyme [Acidimicrobiales bacterium]
GPVAETFPEPLSRLEQDLWVTPLRTALREALLLTGSASRHDVEGSPLVVCVHGRVAVNLELFGSDSRERHRWQRLDPRPQLRRLRVARRVGRLRSALPGLAEDLVSRTDAELATVPGLEDLTDLQLLVLLGRGARALVALHAHEILVGLLVEPGSPRLTSTSVALRVLARGREKGLSDAELVVRHPVVLSLVPPHVHPGASLPAEVEARPEGGRQGNGDRVALLREALRLRGRWLQELTGRAAWELGERLHRRGALAGPDLVRHWSLEAVRAVIGGRAEVGPCPATAEGAEQPPADDPLPARFQLTDKGKVVPVGSPGDGDGSGAGGGRGGGPVCHSAAEAPHGAVLVVRTLDPRLAPALPRLAGLVAETGSALAHLAILAREHGVPTVVGAADAQRRFGEGSWVVVDGSTGKVRLDEDRAREARP